MPFGWFRRKPTAHRIDDALWAELIAAMPMTLRLTEDRRERLRALSEQFLAQKTVTGARGFEVTERVRAAIAAQACLPILELGLDGYRDFVEIVVYPAQFRVRRRRTDEAGVVHETHEWLAGEAMQGGPVVLSWEDVSPERDDFGTNVVLHEFVHKLDMLDGEADGIPPLPASRLARWETVLTEAYEGFCEQLDTLEGSIPPDIDPESEEADAWYFSLPLDAYAATDTAEFFAVSGEVFFQDPHTLQRAFPAWFDLLRGFFRQDPLPDRTGKTPEK